jgi:CheY-like chemotaxis protein
VPARQGLEKIRPCGLGGRARLRHHFLAWGDGAPRDPRGRSAAGSRDPQGRGIAGAAKVSSHRVSRGGSSNTGVLVPLALRLLPLCGVMPLTVLVVDDEPDLLGSFERLLRPLGHLCLSAGGGLDAIALIDRTGPDLVVTDLRLPGPDGLSVARHAGARVPPIPVILMTAYDSSWARRAADEARIAAYLPKPFTNAAFLDTVRRVLSGGVPGASALAVAR